MWNVSTINKHNGKKIISTFYVNMFIDPTPYVSHKPADCIESGTKPVNYSSNFQVFYHIKYFGTQI